MAKRRAPTALAGSDTIYRLLLWLCPAEYRHEYGGPMAQAFRDLARTAYGQRGAWGIIALWARILPDTCIAAFAEHVVALKERRALANVQLATAGGQGMILAVGGTLMRKLTLGLVVLAMVVVGALAAAGIYTPAVQYGPEAIQAGGGPALAAQAVQDALLRASRLPSAGSELVRRQGSLEWENVPEAAPDIVEVRVRRVQLTSSASLLLSLIDDDASYSAQVDATVITADGEETALSVILWDWGLLTPWSFRSEGDGLKPVQVRWM
jgi:hypothetical protein